MRCSICQQNAPTSEFPLELSGAVSSKCMACSVASLDDMPEVPVLDIDMPVFARMSAEERGAYESRLRQAEYWRVKQRQHMQRVKSDPVKLAKFRENNRVNALKRRERRLQQGEE